MRSTVMSIACVADAQTAGSMACVGTNFTYLYVRMTIGGISSGIADKSAEMAHAYSEPFDAKVNTTTDSLSGACPGPYEPLSIS